MEPWSDYQNTIRLGIFASMLGFLVILEFLIPRKARVKSRWRRWPTNIVLLVLGNLTLRLFFPILAVGFAAFVQARGIGLFNIVSLPSGLEVLLAIIAFDLAIWAQHLVMHYVPFLWAFHKVHHADEDLDVTSGVRFHPVEQVLSMGYKFLVIAILGPAPLAVFLFELILNAASLFEHASIRIPKHWDRAIRFLIVTPDMHRVHHSVHPGETNSNFGFCLPLWDRLFCTYKADPIDGHQHMKLGLDRRPKGDTTGLLWGLILPFRKSGDQP